MSVDPEEFIRLRYKSEWFHHVDEEVAKRYHAKNVERCQKAWKEYKEKGRPLRILAIYGSGRNKGESCAREESNSKLLLRTGLAELPDGVEVEEVELRQYQIEFCNNCLSTASPWCGWPCDCFPLDGMQELYPKAIRSDVLLMATGVNQSMISSRLKAFTDRLISADGGYFRDEYRMKTEEFKQQCLTLAANEQVVYTPRLAGRVCGYFITSKDQNNPLGPKHEYSYETLVAYALRSSYIDYGCFHADPWYVLAAANPHEDYQFDKAHYSKQKETQEQSKRVVAESIKLAKKIRREGYEMPVDRINRT